MIFKLNERNIKPHYLIEVRFFYIWVQIKFIMKNFILSILSVSFLISCSSGVGGTSWGYTVWDLLGVFMDVCMGLCMRVCKELCMGYVRNCVWGM